MLDFSLFLEQNSYKILVYSWRAFAWGKRRNIWQVWIAYSWVN